MIEYVYEQDTTYAPVPTKFEAGTQNVEGAIGLAKAIEYIEIVGYDTIEKIEKDLLTYAMDELTKLEYVDIYGPKDINKHAGVISFNVKGIHPHDVASILDSEKVCVRSGNHCAQPLLNSMGIDSTCRASFYMYNTREDVDNLVKAIKKAKEMFSKWVQ
jgi:cysteine desulfurase/selenocysteine lyase